MVDPSQLTEEQRKELEEKLKNMSPEEIREMQKQQCIFCQINSGKIPTKSVYEDQHVKAILDINPASKGHVLIIPKEHYTVMPQVPDPVVVAMFRTAKKLSHLILRVLKVSGTNIFVANGPAAGQRAQHVIVHVIPRRDGDTLIDVSEHLVEHKDKAVLLEEVVPFVENALGIKKKTEKQKKSELKQEESKEETMEEVKEELPQEEDSHTEDTDVKDDSSKEDTEETSLDDIADLFK